ncbi:MAG: HIT family protein [Planctomycetota bacterium]
MADTIFTKILRGEIPCHRVYEDEHVLAFLDIGPLAHGHTLVIPKEPAPTLDRLSDDAAAALGRALPRVCRAVCSVTGTRDYNVLQNNGEAAGQVVMHLHFHIIPKPASDAGLTVQWKPGRLGDDPASLAAEIADAIENDPGPLGISGGSSAH